MSYNLTGTTVSGTYQRLVQVINGNEFYDGFGNPVNLPPQGDTGPQGVVVQLSSPSSKWKYLAGGNLTTIQKFVANNDDPEFITSLSIQFIDLYGVDYSPWLRQLKVFVDREQISYLNIVEDQDPLNRALFQVTNIVEDPFDGFDLNVQPIAVGGVFVDGQTYTIGWATNPGRGPTGVQGLSGPQGVQGPRGLDAVSNFITDFSDKTQVTVTHSFNGYPLVQAVDTSNGNVNIQPASYSVEYISTDTYVVTFDQQFSGKIITGGGATGSQGSGGPQGVQGESGPQGYQGRTGPQGLQGSTGPQGLQGLSGPQGYQGDTGPQGFQGMTGPQGLQGLSGPQGWQGSTGVQGYQGVTGPQGLSGPQGWQGETGVQG